jgi:multidrug resistance protein, MATE family
LIEECVPTLRVVSLALLLFSVAMSYFSGVTGTGNTRFALIVEVITIAIYVLLSWILGTREGAQVHEVWFTEVFYFLMIGLVSFAYMRSGHWKRLKV